MTVFQSGIQFSILKGGLGGGGGVEREIELKIERDSEKGNNEYLKEPAAC